MASEYVTKFEHNSLSEKVDELAASLAETKTDVKVSLGKLEEFKPLLKENFTKLEKTIIKARHDFRDVILTLEKRIRDLENANIYNKGVKDTIYEMSLTHEKRIDKLSKYVGIIGGLFTFAIGFLSWAHFENLKLIKNLFP